MNIISWEDLVSGSIRSFEGGAGTIGVFDGIHRGHSRLLSMVREAAPLGKRAVVTFRDNPKRILKPSHYRGCVFSLEQKLETLEAEGIDLCVLIDFSGNFSRMSGNDFLSTLIRGLPLGAMYVGNDFHCGHALSTDAEMLKIILGRYGVKTGIAAPVLHEGKIISSSGIRHAVEAGRIEDAREMLGRAFVFDLRQATLEYTDGKARILRSTQVLPRHGTYRATILRAGLESPVTIAFASDGVAEIAPCTDETPGLLRFEHAEKS